MGHADSTRETGGRGQPDTLPAMRRIVLRVDAVFLAVAGVFGLVSDLLSYASGSGPFGHTFYQNPTVIGVVEAHGLAVLTAGTLWFLASHHTGASDTGLRSPPIS